MGSSLHHSNTPRLLSGLIDRSSRQILLAIVAIGVGPIDVGQYFRYHHIELSRNFATHPPVLEHQPRHGLVLDDRYLVLLRNFPDAQGIQTGAFGDNAWCAHALAIV